MNAFKNKITNEKHFFSDLIFLHTARAKKYSTLRNVHWTSSSDVI